MLKTAKDTKYNWSESTVEQTRGPEPYGEESAPVKTGFNFLRIYMNTRILR